MNMHVTARDVRTYAEQIANRKAVMARVYGPRKVVNRIKDILSPLGLVSGYDEEKPRARKQYAQHDAHMRVWRIAGSNLMQSKTARFITMRALELGVTHEQLVSHSRSQYLVDIRQQIMWEIYETCGKSMPDIGRLFNRDPTTVLHSIRKVQAMKDKENAA